MANKSKNQRPIFNLKISYRTFPKNKFRKKFSGPLPKPVPVIKTRSCRVHKIEFQEKNWLGDPVVHFFCRNKKTRKISIELAALDSSDENIELNNDYRALKKSLVYFSRHKINPILISKEAPYIRGIVRDDDDLGPNEDLFSYNYEFSYWSIDELLSQMQKQILKHKNRMRKRKNKKRWWQVWRWNIFFFLKRK